LVFLGQTFTQRQAFYKSRGHSVVRFRTERQTSHDRIGARNGKDKQKGTARATRRQDLTSASVVICCFRSVDVFPGSATFYGRIVPLAFRAKLTEHRFGDFAVGLNLLFARDRIAFGSPTARVYPSRSQKTSLSRGCAAESRSSTLPGTRGLFAHRVTVVAGSQ
jgi:hypothetical protein